MKTLTLSCGNVITVDDVDADLLEAHRWKPRYGRTPKQDKYPYADRGYRHKAKRSLHVLICERKYGRPPGPGEKVDHIDGDGRNCRRANLRYTTNSVNVANQSQPRPGNQSGFRGVTTLRHRVTKDVVGYIGRKKLHKTIHTTRVYRTPEEAYSAFMAIEIRLMGESAPCLRPRKTG
jgi:hypothetical protein